MIIDCHRLFKYQLIIDKNRSIKVPMNLKIIAASLKGLLKYRRMAFFFLEHLFSFSRYLLVTTEEFENAVLFL